MAHRREATGKSGLGKWRHRITQFVFYSFAGCLELDLSSISAPSFTCCDLEEITSTDKTEPTPSTSLTGGWGED